MKPFTTDGCSGGMTWCWRAATGKPPPWNGACVEHDYAYWQGGTKRQRAIADGLLMVRMIARGHTMLGLLMWVCVRVGGHPLLPLSWRWGYGHPWPHSYTEGAHNGR